MLRGVGSSWNPAPVESGIEMKFNAAFWKWFGDSKVVDAKGRPLVVYHGTRVAKDISQFKKPRQKMYGLASDAHIGFFFTDSLPTAEYFTWEGAKEKDWFHWAQDEMGTVGARIIPVYLSIQNPLVLSADEWYGNYKHTSAVLRAFEDAKDSGIDGIIIQRVKDGHHEPATVFIALKKSQVKSATGNDGTWDADDPNIRSNPPEIRFVPEFRASTKGIFIGRKWRIWDIDQNGFPAHGTIEKDFNDGEVPDIQAQVSKDGRSGFLRVRKPGMTYTQAAREFIQASSFVPDEFDLTIELADGRYSEGTLDQWMGNNPPLKNLEAEAKKILRKLM